MKKLYFDMNSNARNTNLGQVEKCDSIKLEIKLLQDVDYSDSSFRLLGNKADKNKVEQKDNYISEENKVIFTLKREFLTCPGIVKLELNISTNIEEYTTSMFYFFVSDTINSKIIESIQDVETIQELENYIKNANDNLDKVSETSKELDYLNSKIKPEEEKRLQAEAMRLQNEKFRNIDEHNRKSSEKIREENEDSRNTSEEERVINEETRKNNELKRKTAENLRVSRENSREEAELQRQNLFEENESVRNESENARIKNEILRIKSEKVRITNEDNRILQEENRSNNEETREISENARIEAEKIREQQEEHREQHYNSFNEAENERISNEEKRQEAEIIRNTGEESRNTKYEEAELVRNTSFEEAEKNRSRIYNEAENERAENEKNRIIAESKRNTKEDVRVKAEETRASAETKRVEAEKLRATSEEERHAYIEETVKPAVELVESYDSRITQNATDIKENAKDIERAFETINYGSYLPFEGEDITIEHSKVGFTKDMKVEGMTYQNLIKSNVEIGRINSDTGIKFVSIPLLFAKPNTTYTLIFNIKENTTTTNATNFGVYLDGAMHSNEVIYASTTSMGITQAGRVGLCKYTFTSIGNIPENPMISLGFHEDYGLNYTLTINNIMLLEGDYTQPNSYMPEYFEGIKSVGEKENKISILSSGANLINGIFYGKNGIMEANKDELIKFENNTYSFKKESDGVWLYLTNDDYNFTGILNSKWDYKKIEIYKTNIKSNKKYDGWTPIKTKTFENNVKIDFMITKENCEYIVVNFPISAGGADLTIKNLQITKGKEIIDYNPYKEDKKEILLPFSDGLKGLPSGAKDVAFDNKITQRIGKQILDGNEDNWSINNSVQNTKTISFWISGYKLENSKEVNSTSDELSNSFISNMNVLPNNTKDTELVCFHNFLGIKWIYISIDKTKLETQDAAGFKKWLQANPVEVYYELAEPIERQITDLNSINLETFKDITYVSSENEIQPNLSFKAPVDVPATISSLRTKNTNLEHENKELKDEINTKTLKLHDQDVELTNSDLDLDFRIFELEMSIGAQMNLNMKGMKSMARSPFEMMKILILNNNYDREDIEYKASRYLQGKRITQAEYDEIISLMDANELVK